MLTATFHIGKVTPRACIRHFSTPAQNYIASLCKDWRSPLWNLVHTLRLPQNHDQIYDILRDNQLSTKQFDLWAKVLCQPNIEQAVQVLQGPEYRARLFNPGGEGRSVPVLPPWVLLSMATHLVKTPTDASGPLMDLVFANLDSVPPEVRGPLLIVTAHHLAQHNLLVPFQRVLDSFLASPIPESDQETQYNNILRALSRTPFRSGEGSANALNILQTMDDRGLKVFPNTYYMLLNEDFATIQLARKIFVRVMVQDKLVPPTNLLEAFLRVVTKHGREDLALKFYEAIHRRMVDARSNADPVLADQAIKAHSRATKLMLNSFHGRTEALEFIKSLSSKSLSSASRPGFSVDRSSLPPSPSTDPNLPTEASYNEASALNIASKDSRVTIHRLISIFLSLSSVPTVVTYTILIRGLLARGAYRKAEIWWSKLSKQSTIVMDRQALVAGLQAIIRNGKPHEAFMYLEKYAKKPYDIPPPLSPPPSPSPHLLPVFPRPPGPGENSIELTTVAMNELLVSLNRISRPDIVFRLFTHMSVLYSTPPNAATLSILLQAARMALQKDDGDALAGMLAQIKLLDPFKRTRMLLRRDWGSHDAEPETAVDERARERARAVSDVVNCVGHSSPDGMRTYVSGAMWIGVDPLEFGRRTFLQALFGRAAASGIALYEWMLKMQSPAAAVRDSYDAPPEFMPGPPRPYVFVPPLPPTPSHNSKSKYPKSQPADPSRWSLLTPSGTSHFPSISLTNNNVLNYIQLLCVGNRAVEVPLVLAWVRELGVQPSRSTLALSLVLWSEVSQMAPLVAIWNGKKEKGEDKSTEEEGEVQRPKIDLEEGGEYGKFVKWIKGWVGEGRMPTAEHIQKWRMIVHKMRTSSDDTDHDGSKQVERDEDTDEDD